MTYQILLDTWEGQPLTLAGMLELKANGVAGLFIRLNDMNGGHHMDTGFWQQWNDAGTAGLLRAPYFVYNPWKNGQANYDWLAANIPAEAQLVADDIEVKKDGYNSGQYAAEVEIFTNLARRKWRTITYTGQWFLNYLSRWPNGDYWWAQYPYALYPGSAQNWTFAQLRAAMDTLTLPSNANMIPGALKLWQCSGDRIILPGTGGHPTDINLFRGTLEELESWMGGTVVTPPPTGGTMYGRVNVGALNVRGGPGTGYASIGMLLSGDLVVGEVDVNGWWHLSDATRNGSPVLLSDGVTALKKRAELVGDVWASGGQGSYIVVTQPPVEPPPSQWPAYFDLVDPDGNAQRYTR